nr:hypothetical protein [Tanacetum cinerariifolium]
KPIGRVGSDTFTVKGFNRWRKVNSGKECPFANHEENVIDKQTEQEIMDNRLRLQVTTESTKWLTLETCPLRGGDERPTSLNRGNLLELVDLIALYNKDVARVVLNAPKNAKYTSPDVQKGILQMYAMKVQESIRDEIGNTKFCLIVDESQDESKKEQMDICVRFVDRKGYIKERFLDLVHVKDTNVLTLKNEILSSLSYLKLDVQDIRGQGYDGASNMRGEWNGLKALILNECPFAYYVHCFAHQLQLALVAASKDVSEVHTFFKHLNFIVNVNDSSTKRNDQLQDAQIDEIAHLAKIGELEGNNRDYRQALQNKSQDIVNALTLVSTTKTLIQELRDDGWKSLLDKVVCFCEKYNIPVPDMNVTYRDIIQSRHKKDNVTVEHHYQVDVFIVAIDSQLQELNNRFSESVSELLRLSATLDPRKSFNSDDICKLVTKFLDFTDQDKIQLKLELQHYELDNDPKLKNVTSLSQLCKGLQETEKSETYPLIDRLIRLI